MMKSKKRMIKVLILLALIIYACLVSYNVDRFRKNPYISEPVLQDNDISVKIVDYEWKPQLATFLFILDHPARIGFFVKYYNLVVTFNIQNETSDDITINECYLVDEQGWHYPPEKSIDLVGLSGDFHVPGLESRTITRFYKNVDLEALPFYIVCAGIRSVNSIASKP